MSGIGAVCGALGSYERHKVAQAAAQQQARLNAQIDVMYGLRNLHPGALIALSHDDVRNDQTLIRFLNRFPRSDAAKVARMDKFVDWKRTKIGERRLRHLLFGAVLFFGTPLVIALAAIVWRVALASVLS